MADAARLPARNLPPYRVVIADDHDLARAGLRAVFEDARDMLVIAEARDGQIAVEQCGKHLPHLAVLDIRMPELDGLGAIRAIKAVAPRTAVLVISFHSSSEYIIEAVRLGAAGYLLKDSSREAILNAARRAVGGDALLYGADAGDLLRRAAATNGRLGNHQHSLTPRERDVLRQITEGRTNREIAAALKISAGTVKNHVEHIIAKLAVSDRTQAAVYALRHGLLDDRKP